MNVVITRDEYSEPFYQATARCELLIRYCPSCNRFEPPSIRRCSTCERVNEWLAASGHGVVVAWTCDRLAHSTAAPTSGIVELREGPWLLARIMHADNDDPAVGEPVVVDFFFPNPEGSGERVPVFRSLSQATESGRSSAAEGGRSS